MNEMFDQAIIAHMLRIIVVASFMLTGWLLEAVWRYDKRWLIAIVIFPPSLIIASVFAWETARPRWFFTAIFLLMVLLISGVSGYNFAWQLWILFRDLSIWPYYVLQKLL